MNQYQDNEIYNEAEMESWDFQHDPSTQGRFSYRKRQPTGETYRVLGESRTATARKTQTTPALRSASSRTKMQPASASQPNSRPNRYNASVKMVADGGPAPWEWEQASYRKMPVVGEVAAGRFDVTVAYHEPGYGPEADYVMVNPGEVKMSRNTFALRVRGQSMIDNEIDDGDIIIVEAQNWAEDGDFVIAHLTDSSDPYGFVTLKRFYRHRHADRVVLQPANQSLSPIHILPHKGDSSRDDLDGVKIQGRVSAIIKTGGLL